MKMPQIERVAPGTRCATKLAVVIGRRLFAGVAVALAVACASPTLPLPPPTVDSATAGATPGTVVLNGTAEELGTILIINENSAVPPNQDVSGATVVQDKQTGAFTWTATVVGSNGDVLEIYLVNPSGKQNDISSPLTYTIKL